MRRHSASVNSWKIVLMPSARASDGAWIVTWTPSMTRSPGASSKRFYYTYTVDVKFGKTGNTG